MTQHPDDGVLHALLDGEIRAAELPAIEAHLRSCAACLTRLEEARGFRDEADRLVGEIELPVHEQASAAAPGSGPAPSRPPRRVQVRPLAFAATLITALGLGYGMRGVVGSPRVGATGPVAEPAALEAAPVAPSESSLTDLVSRSQAPLPSGVEDRPRAASTARTSPSADPAPRILASRDAADAAEETPRDPRSESELDTAARVIRGLAAATPAAPSLERNRLARTGQASAERRFEGKVTDASGRGIGGASIVVQGTGLQARTGPDGEYRLAGDIPDSSQVTARAIGHKATAKTVSIPDSGIVRVDFALPTDVYRLEEVVVTGADARRAISSLRSPIQLRTTAPTFQAVDFPEAVRRLGGRIRLVDGLVPSRLEALGDTVRVGYVVARGREVWLRQFRVGDTLAFTLLAPPDFPADSLARLAARVTP